MSKEEKCHDCGGTGWMSDQGPGRPRGAHEYVQCDCKPRNPVAIDWQERAEKAQAELIKAAAEIAGSSDEHQRLADAASQLIQVARACGVDLSECDSPHDLAEDIKKAFRDHPHVCCCGAKAYHHKIKDDRDKCRIVNEVLLGEVDACMIWIANQKIIRKPNPNHSTYGWKHVAEASAGVYVSEGSFILACILLKIPMKFNEGICSVAISEKAFGK